MSDNSDNTSDSLRARIRPYVLTAGRQDLGTVRMDLITVVVATAEPSDDIGLEPEQLAVVHLCRSPRSVAEVAAHLELPVVVVKVLVSDLAGRGYVQTRAPLPPNQSPTRELLEAVLDGIQRL